MPHVQFRCAPLIKEIGRGKQGARGLSTQQANELYGAILRGEVSDLELGAVLIALRVKGETLAELTGFWQAMQAHWPSSAGQVQAQLQALQAQAVQAGKPVVVIPSYNGARRKPNYTPLLAGLLAQKGYPVLVHGLNEDPTGRVTTCAVFEAMQWPLAQAPVFIALPDLYPALAGLLAKRDTLGVRNCTHTLVKFLVPALFDDSVLVCSYTHPEFWDLQRELLAQVGQTALVLKGHEGEPVAAPHRAPRFDGVKAGQTWCIAEQEPRPAAELVQPGPGLDANSTAQFVHQCLAHPQHTPPGFLRQLEAIDTLVAHGH